MNESLIMKMLITNQVLLCNILTKLGFTDDELKNIKKQIDENIDLFRKTYGDDNNEKNEQEYKENE